MKKKIFFLLLIAFQCSSCSQIYYQLVETSVPKDMTQNNNCIVWEDDNCQVNYDFWTNAGNLMFSIYNKTDSILYVDMSRSFFVKNGVSNSYYQARSWETKTTISNSSSFSIPFFYLGVSLGASQSVANIESTRHHEMPIVAIAPHAFIIVSDFNITNERFTDCDLVARPMNKKDVPTMAFNEETSPINFTNYITYSVGEAGERHMIDNHFYINRVTNYQLRNIEKLEPIYDCGKKLDASKRVLVFPVENTGNCFYIRYN